VVRSSEKLKNQCQQLSNGLSHSSGFQQSLYEAWVGRLQASAKQVTPEPGRGKDDFDELGEEEGAAELAEFVMHELIRCDRQLRVVAQIEPQSENIGGRLLRIAREMDSVAADLLSHALAEAQVEIQFYLRNYRHSMLRLSWLEHRRTEAIQSTFEVATKNTAPRINWIKEFTDSLARDEAMSGLDAQLVQRILVRIASAVAELGYDAFAEDIMSGDFLGGDDSPVGTTRVNLIPNHRNGAFHSVLVAVSRRANRSAAFPKIMSLVNTHLIECGGVSRVAIVICDQWDSKGFMEKQFNVFRSHYLKGVRFLFLLAGPPILGLATIPVNFATTSR
jgi:hypothetical protein